MVHAHNLSVDQVPRTLSAHTSAGSMVHAYHLSVDQVPHSFSAHTSAGSMVNVLTNESPARASRVAIAVIAAGAAADAAVAAAAAAAVASGQHDAPKPPALGGHILPFPLTSAVGANSVEEVDSQAGEGRASSLGGGRESNQERRESIESRASLDSQLTLTSMGTAPKVKAKVLKMVMMPLALMTFVTLAAVYLAFAVLVMLWLQLMVLDMKTPESGRGHLGIIGVGSSASVPASRALSALATHRYAHDRARLDQQLRSFSFHKAQCSNERDRTLLRSIVDSLYASMNTPASSQTSSLFAVNLREEEAGTGGIGRFERLVHTRVRKIVLQQVGATSAIPAKVSLAIGSVAYICVLDLVAGRAALPTGCFVSAGARGADLTAAVAFALALAYGTIPAAGALMIALSALADTSRGATCGGRSAAKVIPEGHLGQLPAPPPPCPRQQRACNLATELLTNLAIVLSAAATCCLGYYASSRIFFELTPAASIPANLILAAALLALALWRELLMPDGVKFLKRRRTSMPRARLESSMTDDETLPQGRLSTLPRARSKAVDAFEATRPLVLVLTGDRSAEDDEATETCVCSAADLGEARFGRITAGARRRCKRAAATARPEGGAAWLATMMLLFATMLLLLSRAVTGAVSRGGEQHAETPLKATKATTTMLLPTPLKATKATTMLLPAAAATPLKATKATKTMLLPAAATAGLRRPRRGRGGAWGPGPSWLALFMSTPLSTPVASRSRADGVVVSQPASTPHSTPARSPFAPSPARFALFVSTPIASRSNADGVVASEPASTPHSTPARSPLAPSPARFALFVSTPVVSRSRADGAGASQPASTPLSTPARSLFAGSMPPGSSASIPARLALRAADGAGGSQLAGVTPLSTPARVSPFVTRHLRSPFHSPFLQARAASPFGRGGPTSECRLSGNSAALHAPLLHPAHETERPLASLPTVDSVSIVRAVGERKKRAHSPYAFTPVDTLSRLHATTSPSNRLLHAHALPSRTTPTSAHGRTQLLHAPQGASPESEAGPAPLSSQTEQSSAPSLLAGEGRKKPKRLSWLDGAACDGLADGS
ncbi:hypothetical protein T492DRAFT_876537 [Pavlovales sp. CCMP2436]|nr:hypothetical protein T492DRAFT_876537 [Pavlovales sp. CCMP2436]